MIDLQKLDRLLDELKIHLIGAKVSLEFGMMSSEYKFYKIALTDINKALHCLENEPVSEALELTRSPM